MPTISIQKPTDQPRGNLRLLDELRAGFESSDFEEMWMVVAFAKHGPLLRLAPAIEAWRRNRKSIRAVFGIDQRGTSRQALEFALRHFNEAYIVHGGSSGFRPTFHPKMYMFHGKQRALAFVGSNNLTVGGTETNLECCNRFDMVLPEDQGLADQIQACWDDAAMAGLVLDRDLLEAMVTSGLVLDENQMQRLSRSVSGTGSPASVGLSCPTFPRLPVRLPSPIPPSAMSDQAAARKKSKAAASRTAATSVQSPSTSIGTEALVIQIAPHHNGEVFLSKTAVDQNPAFFGWPFSGQTAPKKESNPSYPQRTPDPVVDLKVFNAEGRIIVRHHPFDLNTVYYEKKHEIRITVPSNVVHAAPDGSIMVMRQVDEPTNLDYDIEIHIQDSPRYNEYFAVCNQQMPSGGWAQGRRFGWL
ncbi:MAG: phospholipase D family protein [Planctomycetes bacterium]|nr:phospholipase D family protein [Planctomycetota bacterium]